MLQTLSLNWRQPQGRGDPRRSITIGNVTSNNCNSSSTNNSNTNTTNSNSNENNTNTNNSNSSSTNNTNSNEWHWQAILEAIAAMDANDPSRRSYESLLLHNVWPNTKSSHYNELWKPFRNLICFMLWLGLNDPQLGMTRQMLTWIINLLVTLQDHGLLDANVWIPTNSSTITKYTRYFPEPPIC